MRSFFTKSILLTIIATTLLFSVSSWATPRSYSSYCPYYCYDSVNRTSKLINWCRVQSFCSRNATNNSSSYKYGSTQYYYCKNNCYHPYRDYYKMKQWCFSKGICSTDGSSYTSSPAYVLSKNYSLRNYNYAKVGRKIQFTLNNQGNKLQWTVTNLPSGATFNPTTLQFIWKPNSWHVGSNFITFTVSNGKKSAAKTIEIKVKEEWENFFLPGVFYTNYIPANTDLLGIYHGVSINYVFLSWVHRNNKRGPSHGRVYFKLDILNSTKKILNDEGHNVNSLLYWAFGVDLSFERFPKRPFLIPFFGLELGGSYSNREVAKPNTTGENSTEKIGGVFHITPTFGMHIFSTKSFSITMSGGYSFPIQDYENLKGWRMNLGFNFTFW